MIGTNNTTTTTPETMTAEQWTQLVTAQAVEYIAQNGSATTKEFVNNATEEEVMEKLAKAIDATEITSGKSSGALKETFNNMLLYVKAKGGQLWNTVKKFAVYIWEKLKALVIGTAYFTYNLASCIWDCTDYLAKETYNNINDNLIQSVKKA